MTKAPRPRDAQGGEVQGRVGEGDKSFPLGQIVWILGFERGKEDKLEHLHALRPKGLGGLPHTLQLPVFVSAYGYYGHQLGSAQTCLFNC